jgi:hypothetical protein
MQGYSKGSVWPSYRSIIMAKQRPLCKAIVRAVRGPSYRSIIMAK